MSTRDGQPPVRGVRGARTAEGDTPVTKALREEAERSWAVSDAKTEKSRRRSETQAKRRDVARGREAEIERLKEKLAELEPTRGRKPK